METHPPNPSAAYFFTKSGSFIMDINEHGKRQKNTKRVNRSYSTPSSPGKNSNFSIDYNYETNFTNDGSAVDGYNKSDTAHRKQSNNSLQEKQSDKDEDFNKNEISNSNSSDEEASNENGRFKFSKMPSRSKYTFVMLAVASFGAGCGFSLMAPFFPREAEKKGASNTIVGLIFSSFQLVNFLASPVYGNFLTRLGAKFVYTSGIMVAGSTSILFGFLDKCPPGAIFIVMSFLVRSVEALGVSAFTTASFAIISNEFPNHIASVFATLETCVGIGLMIGPTIGGVFYEIGGFGMPFWLVGAVIVTCGLAIFTCLPQPEDVAKQHEGTIFTLLKRPIVWVTMLCIVSGSCGIGFLDPTLSNHLDQFGLSTIAVSLFFVIVPGIYAILAPVWGYISDSKDIQSPLLFGGCLMSAIGFLLQGPSPFLPFLPTELWTVTIGLVCYGLAVGCTIVPTMKCLVLGARELGLPENLNTFGLVSGLFNSVFCLGAFIGPTIGGALVDEIGFDYGSTIVAGLYLVSMLCSGLFFGINRLRRNRSASYNLLHGEKSRLLDSEEIPCNEKVPLDPDSDRSKTHNGTFSK